MVQPHDDRPPRDDEARTLAPWQRMLLGIAVVLMLVGGGLHLAGAISGTDGQDDGAANTRMSEGDALPHGFAPTESGGEATQPATEPDDGETMLDAWTPVIFRLGFSFFVGFAIAFALRAFVKLSLITAGVLLLCLFGLQYAGVIDVDWQAVQARYDEAIVWLKAQTSSFTEFIKGAIPSAASFTVGFVAGLRRR